MLKQGNKGGEASALASNDWRVCGSGGIAVKDQPGMARSVHQGNYRMTESSKKVVSSKGKLESMEFMNTLWTLATISETIAHVRQFDAGYADYMARRYARFLPGGEYA